PLSAMSDPGSSRAVRGASLLILLQVGSRALTFTANQILLRFMTASLLGVSAQLEVYYLSVLFFARESLRVAIQRQGNESKNDADLPDSSGSKGEKNTDGIVTTSTTAATTQAAVNISYLAIMLGAAVALVLGILYISSVSGSDISSTPRFILSVYLYAVAAMVELLSEPAFVVMQIRLQFGVRATAEAIATFLRCFVTLGSAVWASRNGLQFGVLPFALGQATYGLALLAVYAWYGLGLAQREKFSLLPVRLVDSQKAQSRSEDYVMSYFYRPTLQLASSMMAQSLVKHVLTQGDTLLVSVLSTAEAQGVYALANNYGGLVARLLLQPIEESSRSYFSRLLSLTSGDAKDKQTEKTAVRRASADLQSLLKVYVLMGLVVISIGPTAAPLLLALVAGPKWAGSGAGTCLSAFAWYVPLLAVNGVAEAFVASVTSEAQVHKQSAWMGAFSLVFAAAGYIFLQVLDMGAVGLVIANCINMLCRITWCALFITQYFRKQGVPFELDRMLPGPLAVLAGVVTSQAVRRAVAAAAEDPLGPRQIVIQLAKIAAVTVPFLAAV
ncbi:Rft-1-domain-containing protein, partial [Coniochaeta ligniaria NRRL 30616]